MVIGYLLDEHIDPTLRTQLLRRLPDIIVWKVGDPGAPPLHAKDPEILRWCEENELILVTNNRKSMPRHLSDHLNNGGHVPGIFVVDPESIASQMGNIIEELILIAGASVENEYQDRIVFLPLT